MCEVRQGRLAAGPGSEGISVRFEVVTDPTDLFVVWDNICGCPALADAELLVYETLPEAQHVADRLNSDPERRTGFDSGNAVDNWA